MKLSKFIITLSAIGIISFLLTAYAPSAWAKKAAFKATVNPVQMNVRIVSGKVIGRTNARVKIERIRRSRNTTFCNKIRQIRIVDTSGNMLDQLHLSGRGLCYFENKHAITRVLQPFSMNELQQVCATSSSRTLVKNAAVNAYNANWDVTHKGPHGNTTPPKNTANIQFKARVTCSRSASSPAPHPVAPKRGEKLFAQCINRNTGVAVQVDMARGIGNLYLKGNSVFNLTTKYLSIRGSTPNNLIELKGNGFRKIYLNKNRKILYFRKGSLGEFCKVRIQRR